MARIDQNGPLGQFRGLWRLGITSSNEHGWYLRAYRTPSKGRTQDQAYARALFTQCAQAWRELSESNKAAWHTAAENELWQKPDWFGNPIYPGGIGLFIRLNFNLLLAGLPIITTPPDPIFPDIRTITSATLIRAQNSSTGSVGFTPATTTDAQTVLVWLTPGAYQSTNPRAWEKKLDTIRTQSGLTSVNIWNRAANRYGLPYVGQSYTIALRIMDTSGRLSPVATTTITVTSE